MTQSLVKCCRKKSRLLKKYRIKPNVFNKVRYKTYRNTLKKCLIDAERDYYHSQFEQKATDLRMTWKLLNHVMNSSKILTKTQTKSFLINNQVISDSSQIVAKFNEYFTQIGTNLEKTIPNSSKHLLISYL